MRSSIIALVLSVVVTSVFSQWGDNYIELSENITKETQNITGFDKIEVSEDFIVYINFSSTTEKVEIEANENLHDLIQVKKEGRTLKIDTKSYSTWNKVGNKRSAEERLVAYINAKQLTGIKGDEDVVIKLKDKLITDKLTIVLDEDCTLEGHLEVNNLMVNLDEDSVLEIEGSAKTMKVEANEDSYVKGKEFTVGDLSIELNEDSEAKLTVNGNIDLVAKDDSYFYYRGDGNFSRKKLRGDSEVRAW